VLRADTAGSGIAGSGGIGIGSSGGGSRRVLIQSDIHMIVSFFRIINASSERDTVLSTANLKAFFVLLSRLSFS
jgi:hypothetical protein